MSAHSVHVGLPSISCLAGSPQTLHGVPAVRINFKRRIVNAYRPVSLNSVAYLSLLIVFSLVSAWW